MGDRDGAELAVRRWRLWVQRKGEAGHGAGKPKTHRVHGLKMFLQPCCAPRSWSRVWGMPLPAGLAQAPSQLPCCPRGGSSAGGSALPGPVVSREMLTPLTRCQNTNTQPDSLKSNYEGAAEPGLAFDSEESCKRHQRRKPTPAQ